MTAFARSFPTLTFVRSSRGYVAETRDRQTANAASSAQSALAGLVGKLARAEGQFPAPGACPDCYGDGHFEVSIIDHGDGFSRHAGTRPFLIECTRCEGSGLDDPSEAIELAEAADREAREWIEVAA